MKKQGFSYVELIFAMIVVISIMAASLPFISAKSKQSLNVYGEYRCWRAIDPTNNGVYFWEQARYNTDEFSEPKRLTTNCKFVRPTGAKSYEITLSGGGGPGGQPIRPGNESEIFLTVDKTQSTENIITSKPIAQTSFRPDGQIIDLNNIQNPFGGKTLTANDLRLSRQGDIVVYTAANGAQFKVEGFKAYEKTDAIKIVPGYGGNAGEVVTLKVPAETMPFDANGSIAIYRSTIQNINNGALNQAIWIAEPSAANNNNGYWSRLVLSNPALVQISNNNCTIQSGKYVCFAQGGLSGYNIQSNIDFKIEQVSPGQSTVYIEGQDGKFNPLVAKFSTKGATGGTCAKENPNANCLTASPTTEIGAGGGGSAFATRYNNYRTQSYNIIRMYTDNQEELIPSYDLILNNTTKRPTGTPNLRTWGYQGRGGGGAIFIKW